MVCCAENIPVHLPTPPFHLPTPPFHIPTPPFHIPTPPLTGPMLENDGEHFNTRWGYLSRAGLNDKSQLMRQVEKYAGVFRWVWVNGWVGVGEWVGGWVGEW